MNAVEELVLPLHWFAADLYMARDMMVMLTSLLVADSTCIRSLTLRTLVLVRLHRVGGACHFTSVLSLTVKMFVRVEALHGLRRRSAILKRPTWSRWIVK
jgi:hypothetical protein